jgi:hypothetical protein
MNKKILNLDTFFRERFNGGLALATAAAALFTVILVFVLRFFTTSVSEDISHWGQFGDYIGGLMNPVIAILTLIGVWTGVSIQRKELKETKDTLQRQLDIDILFRQLQLHQSLVENLEFNNEKGRKIFKHLSDAIWHRGTKSSTVEAAIALTFRHLDWTSLNDTPIPQSTEDVAQELPGHMRYVHDFLKCYEEGVLGSNWLDPISERDISSTIESTLGHYFRSIYSMLRSIQESRFLSQDEKNNLIESLRAQLSEDEFVLLAANCSTKRGRKFRARAVLCDFFHSRLTIHPIGKTFIQSLSPTDSNTTWANSVLLET